MKIQIVSDLHFEYEQLDTMREKVVGCDADVLVLAGDIASHYDIVDTLKEIQAESGKIIVFVPGNHEYYGTSRFTLDGQFHHHFKGNKKIHVLLENKVEIDGVTFLGSTGWWDESFGRVSWTVKQGLNDFRMIQELHADPSVKDGIVWGDKARKFFEVELEKAFKKKEKVVCVSHHYPHPNSLHPSFAGSVLNVCFGNRWEHLFEKYHPAIWIHGHTHYPFDYKVGDTRVVCNPQGYPRRFSMNPEDIQRLYNQHLGFNCDEASMGIYTTTENSEFDPCKVVEI